MSTDQKEKIHIFYSNLTSYLLIFCLFIFISLISTFKLCEYDIWWHLKTGEYILKTGIIQQLDPFSFTASNRPWSTQSWLSGVIFYEVYSLFGLSGLILLQAAIATLTFFIIYKTIRLGSRTEGWATYLVVLVLIITAFTVRFRLFIRPHIFEFLFLATFFYVLNLYKYRRKNYLFLLPVIQILWVNIHGSNILGIIVPLLFLSGEGLKYVLNWRNGKFFSPKQIIHLSVITVVIIIVSLVNPITYKIFSFPFLLTGQKTYMQVIGEWQTLKLTHLWGYNLRYTWGFSLLLLLGMISFISQFKKIDLTEILIFIFFFWLTIKGIRLIAEFAIAVSSIITGGLIRFFDKLRIENLKKGYQQLTYLVLFLIIVSSTVIGIKAQTYSFGLGIKQKKFPDKAVDFLDKNSISGNMFNSIGFGGYLIWRCFPRRKVFIDGRNDVFEEEFYKEYLNAHISQEVWEKITNKYQISYAILEYAKKEEIKHLVNNPEWSLVYWDDLAMIYLKKKPENEEIIKKFSYIYTKPNYNDFSYLNNYIKNQNIVSNVLVELERNVNLEPDCQEAHLALAYIYYALGEYDKAMGELKITSKIKPDLAMEHSALGIIYLRKELYKQAIKEAKHALKINSKDPAAIWLIETIKKQQTTQRF